MGKLGYFKSIEFWEKVLWQFHSKDFPARKKADLQTVGMIIGPYGNLTTLLAAALSLHPECQVLNHAEEQVLKNPRLNFFRNESEECFDRFCQFAYFASQRGRGGAYGGSIIYCHAFTSSPLMRQFYRERYGNKPSLKQSVRSLVWKGDHILTYELRQAQVDFAKLFKISPKIKFLLPIRNPLDCAVTNMKPSHQIYFRDIQNPSFTQMLEAVLRELYDVVRLSVEFPEHFLLFYQDDFLHRAAFDNLRKFLGLREDLLWLKNLEACVQLKESYSHKNETIQNYEKLIHKYFSEFPLVLERFKSFIPNPIAP